MIIKQIILLFACTIALELQGQIQEGFLLTPFQTDSVNKEINTTHSGIFPAIQLNIAKNIGFRLNKNHQVIPLLDLGIQNNTEINYRIGGGLLFEGSPLKNLYYRIGGLVYYAKNDTFFHVPFGKEIGQKGLGFMGAPMGRISYSPHKYFNFQLGYDKNFIGEGSRSLFLSDYGKPYLFGQIKTHFWHLDYLVLYQSFKENYQGKNQTKYAASHFLSWNITKRININFFESVIFRAKDTLLQRGFDPEYLNPLIFYRPQEYAIGSSDNALIGMGLSIKIKKAKLYSQLIIDDFLLSAVQAKSGYWANKIGGQIGFKSMYKKGANNLFYRIELNAVRPYTYSHLNPMQNYGNNNATLSHPLGANFIELYLEGKWHYLKNTFQLSGSYGLMGLDKNNLNYGANIYQSYALRPYDFGVVIGQGTGVNFYRVNLQYRRAISEKGSISAYAELQFRGDQYQINNTSTIQYHILPVIGLRSQLWNDYRNY